VVSKWSHRCSPRCGFRACQQYAGPSFEHRNGHECTDPEFHRHCIARWRGSASLGFAADGNRIRRRVTGSTKTAVLEAMPSCAGSLAARHGPRAPTRWPRRWRRGSTTACRVAPSAPRPSTRMASHRSWPRSVTGIARPDGPGSAEGPGGLSGQLSTRSLQIGRNALERALRFAQVHERVGRNVAVPIAGANSS